MNRILGNNKSAILSDKKISCQKHCRKWSFEEMRVLFEAQQAYGSKWELISQKYFSSRTANSLRCKWYHLTANGAIINRKFVRKLKKWTPEEDKELCLAAKKHLNNGKVEWKTILSSGHFPGRSNGDLCVRYNSVLVYPKRGPWTKQEDEKLLSLVQSHGKKWVKISHILQRPSAAIRRYYEEYLAPGIKRGRLKDEDFNKLAKALSTHGEN
ncbi:hypothetical protein G9A89_015049 [Geosiphon pyriformis]|nr:hypothetical protein G9A89_015049 [Geosiphon pyriformis]